jgi:hypothetical protein
LGNRLDVENFEICDSGTIELILGGINKYVFIFIPEDLDYNPIKRRHEFGLQNKNLMRNIRNKRAIYIFVHKNCIQMAEGSSV